MANDDLANALERNRSLNEENVRLTRELDFTKNELESALSLLYSEQASSKAATPVYVEAAPDLDYDLPE